MTRTSKGSFSSLHFRAKSRLMTTIQRTERTHQEGDRITQTMIIWLAVRSKASRLDLHQAQRIAGWSSKIPSTIRRQTRYKTSQSHMVRRETCDPVMRGSFTRKRNLPDDSWTQCSGGTAEWARRALPTIHLTHRGISKNRLSSIKEASNNLIKQRPNKI